MSVIFDFGIWDGPVYGVAYAVLEQMRALQQLGVDVRNLTIGRPCSQHTQLTAFYGLRSVNIPLPRRWAAPVSPLLAGLEKTLFGKNNFYQIGMHAFHRLPPEKYFVAMHDVISVKHPEKEAPLPAYAADLLQAAGTIITVSEFSKQEIAAAFNIQAQKIQVIYNGCNQERFNLRKNVVFFEAITKKYALPPQYILAYGGNSPRKNFKRLCEAYTRLNTDIPLVIFGGFQYHGPAKIRTLGYISDDAAAEIVKHALAFVLPSYYEGFGLPVIEAMACGVPVACAHASALPEVSGGHVRFFDPFSVSAITAALHDIITDDSLRENLIKRGIQWAGGFTWEQSARKLHTIIK